MRRGRPSRPPFLFSLLLVDDGLRQGLTIGIRSFGGQGQGLAVLRYYRPSSGLVLATLLTGCRREGIGVDLFPRHQVERCVARDRVFLAVIFDGVGPTGGRTVCSNAVVRHLCPIWTICF